ncbi:peroxidase-like [Acanthaster planci]|uniref:Peroxidase-like n=1 Tax=Acanthaster planci TaxID=133434 RepID=A0A8B7XVU3_ACAPL|nr:peroxidase-like [Acanthaster planci]
MIRLLFVVFLASLVACTVLDEDLGGLDLENLLPRDDENVAAYSNDRNPDSLLSEFNGGCSRPSADEDKGRNPDVFLGQFNSAKRSPENKRNLEMYLRKLEETDQPLTKMLSAKDLEQRILQIREALGERQACDSASPGYRTIDGTCNNIGKREQGSAGATMKRLMDNAYDDGLSQPRTTSVNGGPLPSPRKVSLAVFNNARTMVKNFTQVGMHLAQLANHDIAGINCAGCAAKGECFPILIDDNDPVFGAKQDCFNFRRSIYQADSSGVRQQINFVTSYLDASFAYGSDDTTAAQLTGDFGSLKHLTDTKTGRELLPPDKALERCAGVNETAGIYCGKSGDRRTATQPGLTALHTLFLREHNRIAKEFRQLNPSLGADDVYQKARKILGAVWQHIIYNEYLPLVVGEDQYRSKNLSPNAPYAYDPAVDASVANEFAAAAFRFGHSQVPFHLTRANKRYMRKTVPQINMAEAFFNATFMFDESIDDGAVDSVLRGMTLQSMYKVDRRYSDALTNNLFGDPAVQGDGFDLESLDIQRGRDHGIPSYTTIRKDFCGLSEISSFQDLVDEEVMLNMDARSLKKIYGDDGVQDVDAIVGLVLENHLPNTLVGPTVSCIVADQFHRLKFGDRFFYQNPDQFTQAQIDEIKKATMARVMCDNLEAIQKIQPGVFIKPFNFQPPVSDGGEEVNARQWEMRYDSFYEYSRSGTWPHKRATVLDGLDNSRVECASDKIPVVDLSKFI